MKDKQKLQGRQLRPLSALEPACHWSALWIRKAARKATLAPHDLRPYKAPLPA
jgi:hypothetical protein